MFNAILSPEMSPFAALPLIAYHWTLLFYKTELKEDIKNLIIVV
ncbi:hypothetical protein HMPREF9444_00950 [Succinatimonas hippei YIT 12066]|uniref:Uncharacterized protein n=1 Tax=Succinatimonas hippei (strain DSM 22608 / JCM 16073 / KCTC 15190 / YIT 12066) TaxID=762983 RepID=E8LJR6_SUCHY|nr:hypothetical protein HMPREF9444_00950 [Succinatimonas hippei YIT 12066]